VTLEFAAALHASRGWRYYSAGGGGPWILEANPKQELHNGKRTEAAAAAWNRKYGEQLHLWWNNEILKTRYGHVWFLGQCASGPTYPYTEKPGDAWWSFYDDNWDPWQTGDRKKPIGPFKSSLWEIPPLFDCIGDWRDRGLVAIYAHPTRTFRIGNRPISNIAVEFPFDLLAGAPVGALAIMGDDPDHAFDQALWFAALNEGYRVPGVAENDTVFGVDSIRVGPHVTYTYSPGAFDLAKTAGALAAHLTFSRGGASLDRNLLFHAAEISSLQQQIWSTEFAGKPGSLGNVFPPQLFPAASRADEGGHRRRGTREVVLNNSLTFISKLPYTLRVC